MPTARGFISVVLIKMLFVLMAIIATVMLIAGVNLYGSWGGGIMLMGGTLAVVWNIVCGSLMFLSRVRIRAFLQRRFSNPKVMFVTVATLLALLEEVITTTLTNLAPLFGNPDAFITASRNFFEVVVFHSVIVFIPMFMVWAHLLSKYRFTPQSVFLLFGINGVIAETLIDGGMSAIIAAPFWMFIYGLMVFLPAYAFDYLKYRRAINPRWYHYALAPILCLLASALIAAIVGILSPHLPHFGTTLVPPGELH